jgi:SAM-dependent methyltransferase
MSLHFRRPSARAMVSQWQLHGLPEDLSGKSFIDVGCWEGNICAEATKRNAASVLGIDYCTSPDLARNQQKFGFGFIQLDVFSEKLLELPEFDVVHCAGVLYHVENPLSLLFRLRKLCRTGGTLFLETTEYQGATSDPVMVFHPDSSLDDNPSNWWSTNEACLFEMLRAAGFADTTVTFKSSPPAAAPTIGRIGVTAWAASVPDQISLKLLPRRPTYMPNASGHGNRTGVRR